MNKKYRLGFLLILLAVLFTACNTPQVIPAGDQESQRSITVVGTGSVKIIPDIAYINVGVRNQAVSVELALDQNTLQANAVKEELIAQGVAEEDIQTSNFTVYPQNNYDFQGNVTDVTFVVENNVYVTVRDLDGLGALLETVTQSGANSIYGINFDVEDKSDALSEAREFALNYAKEQAEEIAELSGVKLGEVLSIDMYASDTPYVLDGYGIGGGVPQAAAKVPISVGNYVITASATVRYAID